MQNARKYSQNNIPTHDYSFGAEAPGAPHLDGLVDTVVDFRVARLVAEELRAQPGHVPVWRHFKARIAFLMLFYKMHDWSMLCFVHVIAYD